MKKIILFTAVFFVSYMGIAQHQSNRQTSDHRFRISAQAGYSYRLGKLDNIPSDFKDYARKLKSGFNIGIDAAYFIRPNWGLGLKYTAFTSKESLDNVLVEFEDGGSAVGTISDDITITFAGVMYIVNFIPYDNEHAVFGSFGAGYMGYKNESLAVNRPIEITGDTFGATVDFAYDYKLSESIAIGAQISLLFGRLSEITVKERSVERTELLESDNQDDLIRLDFSAGIRFYL